MGSFLTNVQVELDAARLVELVAALDADADKRGLVRSDTDADRRLVVVPGSRWTSVYDEDTESQDPAALDALGKGLTKALGIRAFSVLVHDSDHLRLTLYEGGKRVDTGNVVGRRAASRIDVWRRLAAPGQQDTLRDVFGVERVFAEQALEPLARALGADLARLAVGYKYLTESPLPANAVRLGWRRPVRPTWEARAEGPPLLETTAAQVARMHGVTMPAHTPADLLTAVGGPVHVSLTTMSAGGGGRGVRVTVAAADVVAFERAVVVVGDPRKPGVVSRPLVREGAVHVADFPEVTFPAGMMSVGPPSAADTTRWIAARLATQVHVNVHGTGTSVGRCVVTVSLAPIDGVGASVGQGVAVVSTGDRPLRAPATTSPLLVAPLADRSMLVALVVLRSPSRMTELVNPVADAFPTEGKVSATRYGATSLSGVAGLLAALSGGAAPKVSTGKAKGFFGGKRWADVVEAATSGCSLVHVAWVSSVEARRPDAELSFGAGLFATDDDLPTLVMGWRAAQAPEESVLVGAIDALARDGLVVSGLVTRWGHTPAVDTTPYELACGVHGQVTSRRSWATRWLRGVGPGALWLGAELRARAGAAYPGTELGPVLRIDVADVALVERALAALLPSSEDWRAAVTMR